MKKILAFVLILMLLCSGCDDSFIDGSRIYDYAYIFLPNGEIIEGDPEYVVFRRTNDVVSICINGCAYVTSYENVLLISKKEDTEE